MTNEHCAECGRPIRLAVETLAEKPGTVTGINHHCRACWRAKPDPGPSRTKGIEAGTPCIGCHRPMRPNGTTLTDHPGTVMHRAMTRCQTCRKHGDGAGALAADEWAQKEAEKAARIIEAGPTAQDRTPITIAGLDSGDPDVRHIAQQAQDFLEARRRRGVPPQGVGALEGAEA